MNFNEGQQKFLDHVKGACLVSACAGAGKCIKGDSILLTEKGMIEIKDIPKHFSKNNDDCIVGISSCDINTGEIKTLNTSHWYNMGFANTKNVTTSQGYNINGTYEHPIVVMNTKGKLEFKKLEDVCIGDYVAISKGNNLFGSRNDVPLDIAYCMGVMTGEAHYLKEDKHIYMIRVSNEDINGVIPFYAKIIKDFFKYDINIKKIKDENCYDLPIHSKKIYKYFENLDLAMCKAGEKYIPSSIMQSTRETNIAFLQGLFDTDGTCSKKGIEYCSKSKRLIIQMQTVLTNLGIVCKVKERIMKNYPDNTYYYLYISGHSARMFNEIISFKHCNKKQENLNKLCEKACNDNIEVVPYQKDVFSNIFNKAKKENMICGHKVKNGTVSLYDYRVGRRNPSNKQSIKILNELYFENDETTYLKNISTNMFFDKIVSIEDDFQEVFDFSVPITHSFVANSFINHNTATLVEKVRRMVQEQGINPNEIMVITFTRNAADELVSRLEKLGVSGIQCGTFHSICGRILSRLKMFGGEVKKYEVNNIFSKIILDDKPYFDEVWSWISYQKNFGHTPDSEEFEPKSLEHTDAGTAKRCFKAYEKYKEDKHLMDMDDVLTRTLKLLEEDKDGYLDRFKVDYLIADEAQDMNIVQHKLIDNLCRTDNVYIIGDDKQSIYQFNGSFPQAFIGFKDKHEGCKVIDFNINYRSCKNIVEHANTFCHNYLMSDIYTDAVANNQNDGVITNDFFYTYEDEAKSVAQKIKRLIDSGEKPSDIAVLFRLNEMSQRVELELKQLEVPYFVDSTSSFFKIKEIDAIMCCLRLIQNKNDDLAYEQVFNSRLGDFKYMPSNLIKTIKSEANMYQLSYIEASENIQINGKQYISDNLIKFSNKIYELSKEKDKLTLKELINEIINTLKIESCIKTNIYYNDDQIDSKINALKVLKEFVKGNKSIDSLLSFAYSEQKKKKKTDSDKEAVQLMTIHKSKGLEWKHTFVIGNGGAGKFPNQKAPKKDEACLFYVAVTRARENLYLSSVEIESEFVECAYGDVGSGHEIEEWNEPVED